MKKWSLRLQRMMCAVLMVSLFATAALVSGGKAQAASLSQSTVYYDSDGVLYKVSGDGSGTTEVLLDFKGSGLQAAGSYLYYTETATSTTLHRVKNDGSQEESEAFAEDVLDYTTDNGFIYYLDSRGAIYRTNGNSAPSTVQKIADRANTDFPLVYVSKGRVYYNAVINGKTYAASKATNGSGSVQSIAAGAVEDSYFINSSKNALLMMVNTDEYETVYSTNAVVMYSVNYSTGKGKAVNPKAKLDVNAAYSGGWAGNLYVYNKGIKLDSNKDYNYATGKAFALTTAGKTMQLHSKSVRETTMVGTDKVIIIDADKKAYGKTVSASKVTKSANLNLSGVNSLGSQLTNASPTLAYISNYNGIYAVNTALKVTKLAGEEWDYYQFGNEVPGVFYLNADDQFRLYHVQANGTGKKVLSEVYADRILLATPN